MVTPGLQCSPASWVAWAASRPAIRIFSMVSGVCTCEPRHSLGRFLPTYSGRAMWAGTGRHGESVPGVSGARTVMAQAYRQQPRPVTRAHGPAAGAVVAAARALCQGVLRGSRGSDAVFSATAEVDGDHARVVVTGEVDMATADAMFRAASATSAAAGRRSTCAR